MQKKGQGLLIKPMLTCPLLIWSVHRQAQRHQRRITTGELTASQGALRLRLLELVDPFRPPSQMCPASALGTTT
jgi:hypothetical protein